MNDDLFEVVFDCDRCPSLRVQLRALVFLERKSDTRCNAILSPNELKQGILLQKRRPLDVTRRFQLNELRNCPTVYWLSKSCLTYTADRDRILLIVARFDDDISDLILALRSDHSVSH